MSNKVTIKFDVRLRARGFEMEVDADKADKMMALFAKHPIVSFADLEEFLDLSSSWDGIVNRADDIDIEDMAVVLPEIAALDNT